VSEMAGRIWRTDVDEVVLRASKRQRGSTEGARTLTAEGQTDHDESWVKIDRLGCGLLVGGKEMAAARASSLGLESAPKRRCKPTSQTAAAKTLVVCRPFDQRGQHGLA